MKTHMDDPAQSLPREEALARIREEEEEDVVKIRASKLGLSYIDLESVPLEVEALRLIPEQSARQAGLLVFAKRPKEFSVAMLDPGRPDTKALLKELEKFGHLNLFLASERSFNKYIGGYQFVPHERAELTGKLTISPQTFEASLKLPHSFTAVGTVVKGIPTTETGQLIQHVFATALTLEASDIHIEPEETQTALRYRIDGVLHRIADLASETGKRLGDRVKLLAELKLNVQDSPQDGRFSVVLPNEKIDIRVSTVPGPYGENVVMRLLFEKAIAVRLEDLGLRDDDTEILNRELKRPNGLIVVTGPTGSGKTTTLYACLRKIASPDIKVITLEDPIEYHLPEVEQTQVEPKKGYDFANGLRAILRQDPDVILVGEIRDNDTAATAMHAALTGHLVFTTLHTNDAAGTIPRLIDLGVEPKVIGPAISLAIAQRLVRRLCPHCAISHTLSDTTASAVAKRLAHLPNRVANPPSVKKGTKIKKAGKGCNECYGTGYKGRIAVFEIFEVGDKMEKLIHTSPSENAVYQLAIETGMVTMMQDAILKVLAGVTGLEEVEKVLGPI